MSERVSRKQRFKFWLQDRKENLKNIGIGTIVFIILGVVFVIVGGAINGWDFSFLISGTAITVYILLVIGFIAALPFIWRGSRDGRK